MTLKHIVGTTIKGYFLRGLGLLGLLLLLTAVPVVLPKPQTHAAPAPGDLPTYMGNNARTGYNGAETTLNASNASQLGLLWKVQAAGSIDIQPVVVNGVIYWGSWDGFEHATRSVDGSEIWHTAVGKTTSVGTCAPKNAGPAGTATVSTVSINGTNTDVVLVPGGDDNFYALDAVSGRVLWQTPLGSPPNEMLWAGAAVYNGSVYVGISSYGDCPLTPGHIYQLNASTGAVLHTFNTTAHNCPGAGPWDAPAVDEAAGTIYITTGTIATCNPSETYAYAILEFRASDLTLLGNWQIPSSQQTGDGDFGSSPTLFTATLNGVMHQMVGAVNKNGIYYAFDRDKLSAGPVWEKVVATIAPLDKSSIASSGWDGAKLYEGNTVTSINGQTCAGSVRALDPATGNFLWEYCAPGKVTTGAMVVPGLVIEGAANDLVVLDATTGKQVFLFTDPALTSRFWGSATVSNGVLYIGNRDGNLYAFSVGSKPPSTTPTPSATATPPMTPTGPVSKNWYFAEGRIGKGFREYLTLGNPDAKNICTVNVQYLYTLDGNATSLSKLVKVTIPPASRATQAVNADLGIDGSSVSSAALVASTVTINATTPACKGVVAERPVYFTNFHGISSSTDVVGATALATSYSFADIPTGPTALSYLTILNPNAAAATVKVSYYANGQVVQTQSTAVSPASRGTIAANAVAMPAHVAAVVTSDQQIMVERPSYFSNVNGVWGAADVVGAPQSGTDWLFAEGYTNTTPGRGPVTQEDITIANVNVTGTAAVTITLKSKTGVTQSYNVNVNAQSQTIWNVNANNTFAGSSPEVSVEVKSTGTSLVVQRELYFHYNHTLGSQTLQSNGVTESVGQVGPASKSAYTFAEGYVNVGYQEWLTIQNPTSTMETIYVTLVNELGHSTVQSFQVAGNSRFTQDVTLLVQQHLVQPGDDLRAYEVSMTVQTLNNGGVFIAERPLYVNTLGSTFPTQGGTDVIGYN